MILSLPYISEGIQKELEVDFDSLEMGLANNVYNASQAARLISSISKEEPSTFIPQFKATPALLDLLAAWQVSVKNYSLGPNGLKRVS
jgi:hypothetical protein